MKSLFWLCLVLAAGCWHAAGQTTYDVYINPPDGATFNSIANTSDGGFLLCGKALNPSDSTNDFFFQKYDSSGALQWSKQLTDTLVVGYHEVVTKAVQDYDGNYVFTGTVKFQDDFFTMVAISGKLDSAGNMLWLSELPYDLYSAGDNIVLSPDSDLIYRYANYAGAGSHSEPIVKLTPSNAYVWSNSSGAYGIARQHNLSVNKNGFTVSLGAAYDYYYSFDYFNQPVVRGISNSGSSVWEFPFSREAYSNDLPTLQSVCPTSENGAMICGYWQPGLNKEISLISVSPVGDSLWTRGYGNSFNSFQGNDIQLCSDSGFVIAGTSTDNCLNGALKIFLLKLDSNADSVWSKTFGGLNINSASQVIQTDDEGFLIFGNSSDTVQSFYRVIKTDASGNLNGNPYAITANSACAVYCAGDTAILTVNPSGASYLWSNGDTTQAISVTTTGAYTVTVTDSSGQQFTTGYFNVNVLELPVANLGTDTLNGCAQYSLSSLATTNPANRYQWYFNGDPVAGAGDTVLIADSTGNYALVVSNQCGLDSTNAFVQLNPVPPTPDVYAEGNGSFCAGDSIKLYTLFQGYQYQWYQSFWNPGPIAGATDSVYYSLVNGFFSVEITDSLGCSARSTVVFVSDRPSPTVDLGPDTSICVGQMLVLSPGNYFTYQWQDNSSDSTYTVSATGTYSLRVTNGFGCDDSDTIQVTVNPLPIVSLGPDTSFCSGPTLVLAPGNYASYLWQDNSTDSSYSVSSTGTYSVTVADSAGCANADTILVTVHPLPAVFLGTDTSFCSGETMLLYPGSYAAYLWQDNSTDSSFTVSGTGTYSVTVTDAFGCANSDTVAVAVHPLPEVFLGNDTTLCITQTITLDAGNGFSGYLWPDSSTGQTYLLASAVGDTLVVLAMVTDANGCAGSDTIQVIFDICEFVNAIAGIQLEISPSPFRESIRIAAAGLDGQNITVEVLDFSGKEVYQATLMQEVEELNLGKLASGVYFLVLKGNGLIGVKKLVKL